MKRDENVSAPREADIASWTGSSAESVCAKVVFESVSSYYETLVSILRIETWSIGPSRNFEKQILLFAFGRELFVQTFAKVSCITANDIIFARIVALGSTENQNADLLLRNLI